MNFNFNSLSEQNFTSNAGQYLRPYGIYKVNLTKIEKTTLTGKDGTEYPIVALEFTGCGDDKGIFTTNLFIPRTEKDMERPVFKNNASKIKTVDQFIDLIIKALAGKEKVEADLKLVGRTNNNVVYAALPSACGLTKNGEIFPVNFIGENLFFTNYELTQQKAYQNAKPTNMDKVEKGGEDSADVDLNDIDL